MRSHFPNQLEYSLKQAWMNLYAQGWYHRAGKPGTLNLHPGDLYPSEEAARADIDTEAPYLGTVAVTLPDNVVGVDSYGPESKPIALSHSRVYHKQGYARHALATPALHELPRINAAWEHLVQGLRRAGDPNRGKQLESYGEPESLERADA